MQTLVRAKVRQVTWGLLIITYVAAFVGAIVAINTFPDSGAEFEVSGNELVITGFDPGSELWTLGAREGDIVEQINDQPAVATFEAGERIETVRFREAGSQPDSELQFVRVYRPTTTLLDEVIGLNLIGIAFAVMAVLIHLRARRTTFTILFTYMALATSISLAFGVASVANHPISRIAMGAAVNFASLMFIAFFIHFTRASAEGSTNTATNGRGASIKAWVPELWVLAALIVVVPSVLTAAGVVDLFRVLRPAMLALAALAMIIGLALLAYRLKTGDREIQERLRIVTLGTAIGVVPFIWLTLIPLLITGTQIVTGEIAISGLILIPLTFAYAIAKHDLMGIRRLFHRGAAYAIITAVIIMIYGTVLTGLNLLAPNSDALGPIQGALLVLMFAGAPTLTSVRRTALRLVDRILYEGAVTQADLVSAISTVSANETSPERALDRAISFTGQGFDVEYAALIVYREDGPTVDHVYNSPSPDIVRALLQIPRPSARGARRSQLPGEEQAILIGALREVGKEPRAIVLGPKMDEDIFTDEEVSLLETVTAVVSTALTRIQLIDEVQQQGEQLKNMGNQMQNIQEIERQEISAYLHDEPLQKLAYVNSRVRDLDVSDELKQLLDDVVRDLRGTSASLSPEMLKSHGLMAALKWMVQDQQKRGPFRTFLEIQGMEEGDRLAEDVELTVYRATQEALNNCRKHAKAKSVWIKINRSKLHLDLAVEDNGVGIKATTQDMEERSPDQGLGIRGLEQRIKNLGGTLEIAPRPSRGTAFIVKLPLQEEQVELAS